jgi:hypothetical protein
MTVEFVTKHVYMICCIARTRIRALLSPHSSSRIQSAAHIAVIPYNDQYRNTGFIQKSLEGDQCPMSNRLRFTRRRRLVRQNRVARALPDSLYVGAGCFGERPKSEQSN